MLLAMPADWTKLIDKLNDLQDEFIRVAGQIPPSKREKPGVCGVWSPRQVAAHMTGWDIEVMRQYDLFLDGASNATEHDLDEFNKESLRQRKDLTWQETIDELRAVHKKLRYKAKSIPPRELSRNGEYEEWVRVLIDHYIHHTDQLREWL